VFEGVEVCFFVLFLILRATITLVAHERALRASLASIEVLHGSHVAWQEQKIPIPMGKEVLSYAKYFHCSCHATWLPCKTSIGRRQEEELSKELRTSWSQRFLFSCLLRFVLFCFVFFSAKKLDRI